MGCEVFEKCKTETLLLLSHEGCVRANYVSFVLESWCRFAPPMNAAHGKIRIGLLPTSQQQLQSTVPSATSQTRRCTLPLSTRSSYLLRQPILIKLHGLKYVVLSAGVALDCDLVRVPLNKGAVAYRLPRAVAIG